MSMVFLDYETLRLVWWVLLGVLLIGFAVMDGFDLGVGTLLPFVARTDAERRVVVNTIGPVWEGNQVWLILGAGAIFAAWPPLYAAAFSGFYIAMFLALVALILRPVGFKFRSKMDDPRWRTTWDWALFVGGFVPTLVFGVAVGNVLQGVPFHLDDMLRPIYTGSFLGLFNPFALLAGLVSVAMLVMHGAAFLVVKTDGAVARSARRYGAIAACAAAALFVLAGFWLASGIDGFVISGAVVTDGPSNPLAKTVEVSAGAWMRNHETHAWTLLAPGLGIVGALAAAGFLLLRLDVAAFLSSALSVVGIVATPGLAMFPFIMPSSTVPASSLTVWDASSSQLTLFIMLVATVIFVPLIVAYTAWVYRVLRGKVTVQSVEGNESSY